MIRPPRTHSQYLEFFQTRRAQLGLKIPDDETPVWCKFRRLNLSAAHPILAGRYDPSHGRPARPPEDLLRSWLLMLECHITSVEVWVKRLHEQPLYALMSGFEPDQVPGVGTFYDFQDRMLQVYEPVLNQACRPRRAASNGKRTPPYATRTTSPPTWAFSTG